MKRSSFNTRIHYRDAEKTKSTNQRPANDEGYIDFGAFLRRLPMKTKPYDPERIPSCHRLTYPTDNRVSTYQRPANDEGNFEYEALSGRKSVITERHDPEEIPSRHRWPYSTNNRVSLYQRSANDEGNFEYEALSGRQSIITECHDPEEIPFSHRWPSSTNNRVSTYQRPANDEGNFEYEALSGRQSVTTERHDPEEIPFSRRWPSSTNNRVSTYQRPANDEGNFEYEALSGRQSVKAEPHDPEEIPSSHRWPYSTNNCVSTHQRPTNDESNFEFEALSGRQSVKSEPRDPEEISTSHPLPYLTINHIPNNAENIAIPTVGPPPIMIKESPNFEADLKLIIKKFGQISSKKVGIFFKLCPETYYLHQKLISFFETNNIQYKTPRKIRVFITGLPCHMRTEQIKHALTEKGFEVEEIIQVTEHHTKKPLPLFQVVLPYSDRNRNILYLTNLLNLNISVGNVRTGKLQRHYIKYRKKDMVPTWVNFIKTPEAISWDGSEKYSSKNNCSGTETTCANMSRTRRRRNRRYFH